MARLLDITNNGGRIDKTYMHYGPNGEKQITTTMTLDVQPVFNAVKQQAQNSRYKDLKFKASVDEVNITEFCKQSAGVWGVSIREAYAEIMAGKTDRAKKVWKILTEGRDFRKFQAKNY